MADVKAVVSRALRLIGVKDFADDISSEEMANAIEALNQMMARWEADGIALGWVNVVNVADTIRVPDEALEALQFNLALMLAPEYPGVVVPQMVMAMAQAGYDAVLRDSMKDTIQPTELDLPASEAGTFYNVNSDT